MSDFQLDFPQENAECVAVLAAYRAEQTVFKQTDPEHDGWIGRLTRIARVDVEQLSEIHGRLIAFGLLKFQLTNRKTGVQYQLSSAGVQTLDKAAAARAADANESGRDAA